MLRSISKSSLIQFPLNIISLQVNHIYFCSGACVFASGCMETSWFCQTKR